jgi:hypothetical protein
MGLHPHRSGQKSYGSDERVARLGLEAPAPTFVRRALSLAFGSRAAIALSLCGLIGAFLILPGAAWFIPGAILVLDAYAPLRRIAAVVATILLLMTVGRMTLLALSLLPAGGKVAAETTSNGFAAMSFLIGLLLAAVTALGGYVGT